MAWNETSGTAWTFFENAWHKGNPPIMGAMDHAPWLGSCVFDGGRALKVWPPISISIASVWCVRQKVLTSKVLKNAKEIEAIIREGIAKFPKTAELYLRPMYWAASGFVDVDPESTKFSVSVYDSPLPKPQSFSITLSPFRRPSNEYAPTDAKAACHYPNSARAIRDAKARGFDNAVMLDPLGPCGRTHHGQYLVCKKWRSLYARCQWLLSQWHYPPADYFPADGRRHQGS